MAAKDDLNSRATVRYAPTWKRFYDKIAEFRFEPVTDEIPEPEKGEGEMFPLVLETGDVVYLVIRQVETEIDARSLVLVH